jgi:hypothetical protein
MPADAQHDLLMPSDAKALDAKNVTETTLPEPPSAKMVVRLFLIPLLIAAAVVGIMLPIGWMTGGPVSVEQAMERLKNPGGERTLGLVGPGAKQRYMDAKVLVDRMKAGMDEPARIRMAAQLTELLDKYIRPEEGDIQHFVLLALGRVWQIDPSQGLLKSDAASASREQAAATLMKHFNSTTTAGRKAAILALSFWKGNPEARAAMPDLIERLDDPKEDLDVRIAAAVALGSIASPTDADAIRALASARSSADGTTAELGWNAALSLARLNQPEATDTLLKLLNRTELANIQVYDREKDPKNPVYRKLSDLEQERFIINALDVARHLDDPRVQAQVKQIADTDKSPRVRSAAIQALKLHAPK